MFVRKKQNKSGVISIQVLEKRSGQSILVKTIGSSSCVEEIDKLYKEGKLYVQQYGGQRLLQFENESELVDQYFNSLKSLSLVGPELLLGKIFDEIGFNQIRDELFRNLVITRLVYPVSKLKTADYLFKYRNEVIDVERIYRYLDKLYTKQKDQVQQISYQHSLKILGGEISVVFYDVTTLYFESSQADELRKTGFSKDGKHKHPQIVLGLLVSVGGYPLAYEIFEGNKFEGHTMLPVLNAFKDRFKLQELIVVADAGLLSKENIRQLKASGYRYILGARIKNEPLALQEQILSLQLSNGQSACLQKDPTTRLIITYSSSRAQKDAFNRKKGLEKLQKQINSGKLTKANINNRGYNKYLKMEGSIRITIDKEKYEADAVWDGLKGYLTNTDLSKDQVIERYGDLWLIERAFRISKSDLQIRPIYHRIPRRIEAHICIAFCAYKIYKELERQLKERRSIWSVEQVIDITKTIFQIAFKTHLSETTHYRLYVQNEEQEELLKMFNIQFG
ncbi:MAG: IS1634 family transposase [Tannerella sp.]|jgi:transposase|nr:IS1634 family transposase [Tannerella sp.]